MVTGYKVGLAAIVKSMKKYVISAFMLCSVFQSYAQQMDEKLFYKQRIEKFKRIKQVGVGLTAIGGVALFVGVALTAKDNHDNVSTNPNYSPPEDDGLSRGEITTIGSLFLIGPGVPLWIIGEKGESRYNKKLRAVSIRTNMNQAQVAMTLTYRF